MKKVLLTATVQSHIAQFHLPLIDMLRKSGYEVHVAARNNLVEKNGLKIIGVDKIFDIPFERSPLSHKNIFAFFQLKDILSKNNYDIVHCNTPMGGLVTRLAAKKTRKNGTKVFYTAHGFHFYNGAPLKNWIIYYPIEKWLAKFTDNLITINYEDYEFATRKLKTRVFHTHGVGVNTSRIKILDDDKKEKLHKEFCIEENDFIILCVGELNNNKNQKTLIKAIGELVINVPNVKLLLAGNGPNNLELEQLVIDLDIVKNVRFLGYRTDLNYFYNICDVVASVSYREGLPLNILEAMFCSKPVVASLNRGHNELVHDNKSGILVNPNDHTQIKEALLYLFHNQEKCIQFGEEASILVKPYIMENVLNEIKLIYNKD